MSLSFGRELDVTIVGLRDVQPRGDGTPEAEWLITGRSPQFRADLPLPLRAGTYRLSMSDFATDGTAALKVLFDIGHGFPGGRSEMVYLTTSSKGWEALLSLPHGTREIRIEPVASENWMRLGSVTISRVSTITVRMGGYLGVVRRRLRSMDQILGMIRRSRSILRAGGMRALVRSVQDVLHREVGRGAHLGYGEWIARYDTFEDKEISWMAQAAEQLALKPKFSILMPVYNTPREFLVEAIESVTSQIYQNWELCIADDASTVVHVREVLESYARADARIKVTFRNDNGHISKSSNTALELATGDWIVLLDHDDKLALHSLYELAVTINQHSDAKLIYSDEDKLDVDGRRCDPYFKPDWNYELFLSQNLITHLAALRIDIIRKVGGFRVGFEGAQDYDLFLRVAEECELGQIVHIPKILYHWRILPGSTALSSEEKPYAMLAGERALNEHLGRTHTSGESELIGFGFRTRYRLPQPLPLVSIIIPTRDRLDLVGRCVSSIFANTDYQAYEILIVDNGSSEPATFAWFRDVSRDPRVKIIRDDGAFNYSRLNNMAASHASGEFLLLLNNDIEVISGGWLSEMVGVCSQAGVGAVGACLWYPDNTMQHGGVIMGLGGLAAHAHDRLPRGHAGYVGRAALRHEVSAVTGACLLTRREAFHGVAGLDEVDLTIAYNDIDYCLKLRSSGWRIVWTPFAELYHYESASRGYEISAEKKLRFEAEKKVIRERWGRWIKNDPSYNPNLTLDDARFSLAFPPRRGKLSSVLPEPR